MLYDNHGRPINYMRLAVTDRCNLRCFYCMPAEGIDYVPRKHLMTYEEMIRLVRVASEMGIDKLRITGGEPFIRRDIMTFLEALSQLPDIKKINITTNGTRTYDVVPALKKLKISSVNLSLDTLDKERFFSITRRNVFDDVMRCLDELLRHEIPTKINAVVMDGKNTDDIIPMAELSRKEPVSVRFIEEMPFNGEGMHYPQLSWDHKRILERLREAYPNLEKIPDPESSTASHYRIPGAKGNIGIIAAFTRTFCGTCNRIRVTPEGTLKTCLYDDGVLNFRDIIRDGGKDQDIRDALLKALGKRAKNGFEAERRRKKGTPVTESMSTIGG